MNYARLPSGLQHFPQFTAIYCIFTGMKSKNGTKFIISNPHDKAFRDAFERREFALSVLKEYLPAVVVKNIDFRTLKIAKDTHIDKELAEHFSDILYEVKISKKHSYIYILFEHKSYSDLRVSFQLLRNMIKTWEGYLKQNSKAKKLPVILPLLFYHGKGKWRYGNKFSRLFDVVEGLGKYIPDFTYEVLDVSHIPDSEIRGAIETQVLLYAFKYIFSPDLMDKLPDIFKLFNSLFEKKKKLEYIELLIRYLTSAVSEENRDILKETFEKVIDKGDSIMPSIAEAWVREGIEKGIEQGIEKGIEQGIEKGVEKGRVEGIEKGIEKTALKMIDMNMSTSDIHKMTGLSAKRIETLIRGKRQR